MAVGHQPDPYAPQPPNIHLPQTPIHRPMAPWNTHPMWSMPIPSSAPSGIAWGMGLESQTPSMNGFGKGGKEVKQLENCDGGGGVGREARI